LTTDSDTNGNYDVFVRDLQSNTTKLGSVSTTGTSGNSASFNPVISADGRYVAFYSYASNLTTDSDTNGTDDVFVRDLQSNTTKLVSVSTTGTSGNSAAYNPVISADGRYVAFYSYASNLTTDSDTNGTADVFVRDLQANTTKLVSVSTTGTSGNNISYNPVISAGGRYVAFYSYASNLTTDSDTNSTADVFVRDLQANTTKLVSVSTTGTSGNNISYNPLLSADRRYVAFYSAASNLTNGDTNGTADVFVR